MTTTQPSSTTQFDPFHGDRLCRDIRNDLSESLMRSLESRTIAPSLAVSERYSAMDIKDYMRQYLNARISCYRQVISQLNAIMPAAVDAYVIALLLWDEELFFEVHEWLESQWYNAQGVEKKILQALIRAAGTYVHLIHGRNTGAEKMSAKAIEALTLNKKSIPAFLNIELLLKHLKDLSLPPPQLGSKNYIKKHKAAASRN